MTAKRAGSSAGSRRSLSRKAPISATLSSRRARAVVEADEALSVAGRAAHVRIEERDSELVDQIIVAPEEARPGLALRPTMDADDQWAAAGEAGGIGPVEEARDPLAVEAPHLDQLGLGVAGGVEPAGLAARPAVHLERRRIDRIGVGRASRRGEGEADRAPGRDLDPADHARRQRVDQPVSAGGGIEQAQPADPGLVGDEGDEAAVWGDVEAGHVPVDACDHRREAAARDVEPAQPLNVRAFVRCDPERAVGRERRAAIGDLAPVVADGREAAIDDVDQVQVRFGHLDIFDRHRAPAVGREIGDPPAAARHLGDHAGRSKDRAGRPHRGRLPCRCAGSSCSRSAGRHGSRRRTGCGFGRR